MVPLRALALAPPVLRVVAPPAREVGRRDVVLIGEAPLRLVLEDDPEDCGWGANLDRL